MRKKVLLDLLDEHADALRRIEDAAGFDSRAWLAVRRPAGAGHILVLLQLAQAVKQALVPVQMDEKFTSELQKSLLEMAPAPVADERSPQRHLFFWAAAAVGLSLFMLRRLKVGHDRRQSHVMTTAV
jgi:hypothetical protein